MTASDLCNRSELRQIQKHIAGRRERNRRSAIGLVRRAPGGRRHENRIPNMKEKTVWNGLRPEKQ